MEQSVKRGHCYWDVEHMWVDRVAIDLHITAFVTFPFDSPRNLQNTFEVIICDTVDF